MFSIYASWTGDYHAYNLCNPSAFPGLTRKERADQFSRVVYYPPSDKRNRGAHMPVTRAEPLVSGKRGVGRGGDARCCRIPDTLKVANTVFLSFSGRRLEGDRSCSDFLF